MNPNPKEKGRPVLTALSVLSTRSLPSFKYQKELAFCVAAGWALVIFALLR